MECINKKGKTLDVSLIEYVKNSTTYLYKDGVPIFVGDIVVNKYGKKAEVLFGEHLNKYLGRTVKDLYFRCIDENGNYTESYDLYSFCTDTIPKTEMYCYVDGIYRTLVKFTLEGITLVGHVEHSDFRIRLANLIRDIASKAKIKKDFILSKTYLDKLVRMYLFDGDLSEYTFNYYQLKVKEPLIDYLINSKVIKVVYGLSVYKYPEYSLCTWDSPEHIDRVEYYDSELDEIFIIEDKEDLDRIKKTDVVTYYIGV